MLLEILFLCGTHRNCVIEIRAIASNQQQSRCAGKVQGLNYSTNGDGSQASNSGRSFDTCTTRQHYTTSILSQKPFACILVRSRSRDFYTIYFGGIAEIPARADLRRITGPIFLKDIPNLHTAACNQPRLRYVDQREDG